MEKNLLCSFEPEMKFDKDCFKVYYQVFLKRSWPLYGYILFFSIVFIVFYILWPSTINLVCAILWPILATLLFVGLGGLYRAFRYKKKIETKIKNINLLVYSDLFEISYVIDGNSYTDQYSYTNLKKLIYNSQKEKLFFLWKNGAFFAFDKSDFNLEAFEFLSAYCHS